MTADGEKETDSDAAEQNATRGGDYKLYHCITRLFFGKQGKLLTHSYS